ADRRARGRHERGARGRARNRTADRPESDHRGQAMTIAVFISSLLGFMALGMPVAFPLISWGLAMMFFMGVTDPQIVIQNMWDGANSFPLLAVPFFMLAGEFMNA